MVVTLIKNDFTHVSTQEGASVVDYCLVPHENEQIDSEPRLENYVCFTKYDRKNMPSTFMVDQQVMRQLNDTKEKLETHESDQQSVDTVYKDFCETLKSEMNRLLNPK